MAVMEEKGTRNSRRKPNRPTETQTMRERKPSQRSETQLMNEREKPSRSRWKDPDDDKSERPSRSQLRENPRMRENESQALGGKPKDKTRGRKNSD